VLHDAVRQESLFFRAGRMSNQSASFREGIMIRSATISDASRGRRPKSHDPERAGCSRPRRRPPHRMAGATSSPELSAESYVFAAAEPSPGVTPFAVIREDEGVTLVLTRSEADLAALDHGVNPATPGVNIPCAAPAGLATMSGSDGRVKPTTGPRPEG